MAVNDAMREQCLRVRTPNVENTFRPWQGCCPDEACSGKEMSRAAQHRAFRSSQQTMVFLVGLAAQEEAQQRCGSSLEENREPFTTSSCKPQIDVRSSCGNGDSWHFLWLEREGPAVRKLPAPLGLHSWVPWAAAGMPADHSCLHSPPPPAHLPLAGALHSSWSLRSALLSFHFCRHFLQASGTSRHHSRFTNQAASFHCPPLW